MSRPTDTVDAVIIGSGPNGLVAANRLADAGWSTLVLEAEHVPGGAVRSAELTLPGFVHDVFSSVYPLAAFSPALTGLHLEDHGLAWRHATYALAHARPHAPAGLIHRHVHDTAAHLQLDHGGDAAAWTAMYRGWEQHRGWIRQAMFDPLPPLRGGAGMLRALRVRPLEAVRFALLPVRRMAEEWFGTDAAKLLLFGNALHTDLSPEGAGSGLFGALLTMLAQDVGFPVPAGGAQALTSALCARLAAAGGAVRVDSPVDRVLVEHGRAWGVALAGGGTIRARRAVVADVDVVALVERLLRGTAQSAAWSSRVARFQYDHATVKVDWALRGEVPWNDPRCAQAGTVHIGADLPGLSRFAAQLAAGEVPDDPFALVGQPSVADASRCPPGHHVVWAYTHVPVGALTDADGHERAGAVQAVAQRLDDTLERYAPGFTDRVIARHVLGPGGLQARNRNLVDGTLGGGSAALHQQLVLRPFTRWGRPTTPVPRLYLGSASAHPGGGVHGAAGDLAARAALGLRHRRYR